MHIDNGVTVILSRVGWVRNKVFFMSKLTAMVYFGQRKCCGLHVAFTHPAVVTDATGQP